MDFGVVLVIGISVPVTALIIVLGINRNGGKAKFTVGTKDAAASLEVGKDPPERRELDRPEGVSRLASELIPILKQAIDSHVCRNAALISTNAEVSANLIDRSIEVGSHAIETYKVNGVVEGAVKSLKEDRLSLRRAIANPGGA